jgi:hypothetical protein
MADPESIRERDLGLWLWAAPVKQHQGARGGGAGEDAEVDPSWNGGRAEWERATNAQIVALIVMGRVDVDRLKGHALEVRPKTAYTRSQWRPNFVRQT